VKKNQTVEAKEKKRKKKKGGRKRDKIVIMSGCPQWGGVEKGERGEGKRLNP